jgi:hypothetical protein
LSGSQVNDWMPSAPRVAHDLSRLPAKGADTPDTWACGVGQREENRLAIRCKFEVDVFSRVVRQSNRIAA